MKVPIFCPDCGVTFEVEAATDSRKDFRSFCCDPCARRRSDATRAKESLPVGGESCTDAIESKMHFPPSGLPFIESRSPGDTRTRGGRRVIRKSEPMGG